jgi:S-adenosylmethionine decarboxylase
MSSALPLPQAGEQLDIFIDFLEMALMLDKNIKSSADSQEPVFALGRQLTIEYYDCGQDILVSKNTVEKALLKGANDSGATIINSSFHQFDPQGVSGVVIIAESHFTVHAWPEHDYAAVDIFTCGDKIDLDLAIHSMEDSFGAGRVVISSDQNRGIFSSPARSEPKSEPRTILDTIKDRNTLPISWKKAYDKKDPWGVLTSVDIYDCVPGILGDAGLIEKFAKDLCVTIGIKPLGNCRVVRFGADEIGEDEKTAGYSMTQLIETSLISGHFVNATHTAYLDILSCKFYEPRDVAEFAMSFFKGGHYKMQIALRQ